MSSERMVTQTCGCACAGAAKANMTMAMRAARIMRCTISWSAAEWGRLTKLRLNPRRAAVGARVVAAFQSTVGMQDDGAGVAHGVGIGLVQHFDVVAGRHQPVDKIAVEARFEPQVRVRRAPGAAEQPAWRVERLVQRLAERDVAREDGALR